MASPAGFEPAWDGLEIRCLSIRLRGENYETWKMGVPQLSHITALLPFDR